jgi:hypothetical protein
VNKSDLFADSNHIVTLRRLAVASQMVRQDLQLHAGPDVITGNHGMQQCACCLERIDLWSRATPRRADGV